MTHQPWWERWPGRLESEEEQLRQQGLAFERSDSDDDGLIRFKVSVDLAGSHSELQATFPHLYPYFPPVVSTTQRFRYHQNPFNGELCLLARTDRTWLPGCSLAWLITEQLPKLVQANTLDDDEVGEPAELEEQGPEPLSGYYDFAPSHVVLIDSDWTLDPTKTSGSMEIGLFRDTGLLRGVVLRVVDDSGTVLAEADRQIIGRTWDRRLTARWYRLTEPIDERDADAFVAAVEARIGRLSGPGKVDGSADLVGVVYTDDIRYGEPGDDWVFILNRYQPRQRASGSRRAPARPAKRKTLLVKGMRAGRSDIGLRVPQLRPLASKSVAVVGLGALGAPAALSLARSGVGALTLIDYDVVDPGTQPRWPVGAQAANHSKVQFLAGLISDGYLYCSVSGYQMAIGHSASDPRVGVNEMDVLADVLDGSDLILDASANPAVNHVLSDLAFERGVPYLGVSATEGAWGGLVVRLERGRTGCYLCLMSALDGPIPLPPSDESGRVAPVACLESTFTGPGFDLTPLADEAVRLAISRLSEEEDGGYPPASWDVETLALRDNEGRLIPATWKAYHLPPDGSGSCPGYGRG